MNNLRQQPFWDMTMTLLRLDPFATITFLRHDIFETWPFCGNNFFEAWSFWDKTANDSVIIFVQPWLSSSQCYLLVMSLSWNFPARAELGHFNFWANWQCRQMSCQKIAKNFNTFFSQVFIIRNFRVRRQHANV